MNKKIESILLSKTHSTKILKTELIQELWSGYGHISRIHLDNCSVILKLIKYPEFSIHPRGWNSENSHNRKIKSYQVEMNWYKNYNHKVANSYSPNCITSGEVDNQKFLVLEDLQVNSFRPLAEVSWTQIKQCLSWLANFHTKYLNSTPSGLWDIGTYWHLKTRPDELEILSDIKLKEAASAIDKKLNSAKFKTFVHGDAKLANFLFNQDTAAAVDFQYVGGGVGIKDVAYFLSSVYDENQLNNNEAKCLSYYFAKLNNKEVEQEWRELYPFAWCDFYRFLQGWSPSHSKINSYSQKMTTKVLACL